MYLPWPGENHPPAIPPISPWGHRGRWRATGPRAAGRSPGQSDPYGVGCSGRDLERALEQPWASKRWVSKWCVSEWCVSEQCVSKRCLSKRCVQWTLLSLGAREPKPKNHKTMSWCSSPKALGGLVELASGALVSGALVSGGLVSGGLVSGGLVSDVLVIVG